MGEQGFNHFGYGIPEMVHSLYDYLQVVVGTGVSDSLEVNLGCKVKP